MLIDFNDLKENIIPGMNNGSGTMSVRMYNDENYRIILTKIHAGSSIGLHAQNSEHSIINTGDGDLTLLTIDVAK